LPGAQLPGVSPCCPARRLQRAGTGGAAAPAWKDDADWQWRGDGGGKGAAADQSPRSEWRPPPPSRGGSRADLGAEAPGPAADPKHTPGASGAPLAADGFAGDSAPASAAATPTAPPPPPAGAAGTPAAAAPAAALREGRGPGRRAAAGVAAAAAAVAAMEADEREGAGASPGWEEVPADILAPPRAPRERGDERTSGAAATPAAPPAAAGNEADSVECAPAAGEPRLEVEVACSLKSGPGGHGACCCFLGGHDRAVLALPLGLQLQAVLARVCSLADQASCLHKGSLARMRGRAEEYMRAARRAGAAGPPGEEPAPLAGPDWVGDWTDMARSVMPDPAEQGRPAAATREYLRSVADGHPANTKCAPGPVPLRQ